MTRDEALETALDHIPALEDAFEMACKQFAESESEYRVRKSKAYLAAEGTEKAREAKAILDAERFLRERDKWEAVKEFTQTKIRDAQLVVSARQSLLTAEVRTNNVFTGGR
jgi:hypothetical protein